MLENKYISQLKDIIINIFPKNRNEYLILLTLLIFYLSYSLYIAIYSHIIDDFYHPIDTYFSFDISEFIHSGGKNRGPWHSLLKIFIYPILVIGNILITLTEYGKSKTILFVITSTVLISLSIIYIYRYFVEIILIRKNISLLFILSYSTTATNLILSFTIESFSISLFFLSYMSYYYAYQIKSRKDINFISNLFFTLGIAGTTVTNIMKVFIPVYYIETNKRKALASIILLGGIIISITILLNKDIFQSVSSHLQFISNNVSYSFFEQIVRFYGSPIIFPDLTIFNLYDDDGSIIHKMIDIDYYTSIFSKVYLIILFIYIVHSVCFNLKNKYTQILILPLIIDLVLHLVIRFGLEFPFIYGAHWIYCIPLLLGWSYNTIKSKWIKRPYIIVFSTMTIFEVINNANKLYEFINLSTLLYP